MSKQNETPKSEVKPEVKKEESAVAKGLQIRKFEGSIAPEDKDKLSKEEIEKKTIKFNYERVVFPWSRAGKDVDGQEASGAVPSLAELLAYCQTAGFATEFKLDKEGNPDNPATVVGFIVDGLNRHLNQTARAQAQNTPVAAKERAIAVYMKMRGCDRPTALSELGMTA